MSISRPLLFFIHGMLIIAAMQLFTACQKSDPAFHCSDPAGCVDIRPGDPIHIGVLQALTGKVASLGIEQVRGIELSLAARGSTLAGHPIELHTEDTQCTAEGGAHAALKIVAHPQIVGVIGTTCSVAAAEASRIISQYNMVMISGNNSAPHLTSIEGKKAPDWQYGFFRTANNEETAGEAAALYAYQNLHIQKAATISDGDIYTTGLADGFRKAFEKLGGRTVFNATINKGDTNMNPVLDGLKLFQAELLFFPLFKPEADVLLTEIKRTQDFQDLTLISDGALIDATFLAAAQDKAQGMYFVGPAQPTTKACRILEKQYMETYNSKPMNSYYLSAYDAAAILFTAIEKTMIREKDGSLHIGRDALRKNLYAVSGFEGATGTLSCNEFGDCTTPKFSILRMDDPEKGLEGLLENVMFTYRMEKTP